MFTPYRVAGGPGRNIILKGKRITKGTFVASGKEFEIVDSYVDPSSAYRMLYHGWIGTSEFREDEINEKQNGDEKQKILVLADVESSDDGAEKVNGLLSPTAPVT